MSIRDSFAPQGRDFLHTRTSGGKGGDITISDGNGRKSAGQGIRRERKSRDHYHDLKLRLPGEFVCASGNLSSPIDIRYISFSLNPNKEIEFFFF